MNQVVWLRVEGAVLLSSSVAFYSVYGASWWLFTLLLFAPDLFMLGYLKNPRTGALIYNVGHSYLLPALLLTLALTTGNTIALALALIWFAHIGLDRLLGYGLKYSDAFKSTHLSARG